MKQIEKKLEANANQFEFEQAVKLLKQIKTDQPIRFSNTNKRRYALSDIEHISLKHSPKVTTSVIGLLGENGILPNSYHEFVKTEAFKKNSAPLDFFNQFSSDFCEFKYQAWEKSRQITSYYSSKQSDFDPFTKIISSLLGHENKADQTSLFHASRQIGSIKTSMNAEIILSSIYQSRVKIKTFSGHWQSVPVEAQSQLSSRHNNFNRLGKSLFSGERFWKCQNNIDVIIGPISYETYQDIIMNKPGLTKLHRNISSSLGSDIDYNAIFTIKPRTIPRASASAKTPLTVLGENMWAISQKHKKLMSINFTKQQIIQRGVV